MAEAKLQKVLNDEKSNVLIERNAQDSNETSKIQFKLKVYKRRWLILLLFMLYAGGTTYQWVQYSIIANIVSRYYGVSSLAVDWTAMSYMAYYVVLIFPASYLADFLGLRWSTVLGCGLNCLGTWIKVFSVAPNRFYVTFIGQSFVACTQTLVLTAPGRLAAYWFDSDHISMATSFAILGNQLGVALGFLITPMIVRNHEQLEDIGDDLSTMFWILAIFSTFVFILILLFFQKEPKLPPSETRALQKITQTERVEESYWDSTKRLFKNKSFLILCNTYGINVGVLNVVGTLLNPLFLLHFQNGEQDAGRIGLGLIVSGMIGSLTLGIILDKTHKFKETAVAVYFLTFLGQIIVALALIFEVKWLVYVTSIFLGFFMSGYFALGYELCAEYTYPESEEIATGILNIGNNIYGVILVIIMGKLLEKYGDVSVHISLCSLLFVGFVITVLTKDEQRRQSARKTAQYRAVNSDEKEKSAPTDV